GASDQRIGRRDRQQQQEHRQLGLIHEVGEGVQETVSASAEPPAERVGEAPGKSQRERNREERYRNPAPRMRDKRERPHHWRQRERARTVHGHATLVASSGLTTGSSMVAMTP